MAVVCSHCQLPMPPDRGGHEIAVGWTVVRIETHNQKDIDIYYLYLCPGDMLKTTSRQATLDLQPSSQLSPPTTPPETEPA